MVFVRTLTWFIVTLALLSLSLSAPQLPDL